MFGPLALLPEETGQGQVVLGRGAAMLLGDDVVDGEGDGGVSLRETTIFAALACLLADQGDQRPLHGSMAGDALLQSKLSFGPQQVEL